MKRILLILVSGMFLISCGPKRLRCGPNRKCELQKVKHNNTVDNFSKTLYS